MELMFKAQVVINQNYPQKYSCEFVTASNIALNVWLTSVNWD